MSTTNLDRTAAIGSIACIVHCLALPALAVTMPFLAAAAEAEWVHWAFAVLAVFASGGVIALAPSARTGSFVIPAGAGIALVVGGLFVEHIGVDVAIPTVIGGCLLAFAHIRRLLKST